MTYAYLGITGLWYACSPRAAVEAMACGYVVRLMTWAELGVGR